MTSNQPFRGSASEHSRQQLRSPRFRRVARDVYVMADRAVDLRDRVRAAQLVVDDGVPCLATAALLQRLPADDGGVVHLARGRRGIVSTRPGIEVHRLAVADDELMDIDGLLVTDGPRTLADLRYGGVPASGPAAWLGRPSPPPPLSMAGCWWGRSAANQTTGARPCLSNLD